VMGLLGNLSCAQLLEMMAAELGRASAVADCRTVLREIVMLLSPENNNQHDESSHAGALSLA
jgi:hypothetical protein